MTIVHMNGRMYRVSPGGLVWAGYTHPNTPDRGVLWRRLERGSPKSAEVLMHAGMDAKTSPAATTIQLTRSRLYAIV